MFQAPTPTRALPLATLLCVCVSLWWMLPGCAAVGPVVEDGKGISNSPANRSVWDPEGRVESTLHGGFPANVETSAEGANIQSSGQPRVLTFSIQKPDGSNVVATLNDPSDTEFSGFRMAPDGSIEIAAFGASASAVLAVQNEAVIQSLLTTEKITAEQAAVIREAIAAGATVAQAIAEVAGKALVPLPDVPVIVGPPSPTPSPSAGP